MLSDTPVDRVFDDIVANLSGDSALAEAIAAVAPRPFPYADRIRRFPIPTLRHEVVVAFAKHAAKVPQNLRDTVLNSNTSAEAVYSYLETVQVTPVFGLLGGRGEPRDVYKHLGTLLALRHPAVCDLLGE